MAGNDEDEFEVESEKYRKDPRIPCKYGKKCYQKNTPHHKTYKHPPKRKSGDDNRASKKLKLEEVDERKKKPSPFKDIPASASKEEQSTVVKEVEKSLSVPEEDDLPPSPEGFQFNIKQKFLVEMPDDFYSFWSFCESISSERPEDALKELGLQLVGPYDIMSGKLRKLKHRKLSSYLIHWRYYYDPPEFQTVIKGDDSKQFHLGYYRDDPQEKPCFVASNAAAVDCTITPMAENIFGAVNSYLETTKEKSDPFLRMKISKILSKLQSWAKEHDFTLEKITSKMKERRRKVVTKTFHKAGIVVPVEKKTELGYRELIETDENLHKILKKIVEAKNEDEKKAFLGKLDPIVNLANIANDECDFGTSLELGLDLFCFGGEVFHSRALHLLKNAYTLLERNEFAQIAEAHIMNRRKGPSLSIME